MPSYYFYYYWIYWTFPLILPFWDCAISSPLHLFWLENQLTAFLPIIPINSLLKILGPRIQFWAANERLPCQLFVEAFFPSCLPINTYIFNLVKTFNSSLMQTNYLTLTKAYFLLQKWQFSLSLSLNFLLFVKDRKLTLSLVIFSFFVDVFQRISGVHIHHYYYCWNFYYVVVVRSLPLLSLKRPIQIVAYNERERERERYRESDLRRRKNQSSLTTNEGAAPATAEE